jgi:hypothetical protein
MLSWCHGAISRTREGTRVKRTRIQIDEETYEIPRRRAFEKGCSISSIVRDLLAQSLRARKPGRKLAIKDFTFIAAGRSRQGRLAPVSERHDEALAEALTEKRRR